MFDDRNQERYVLGEWRSAAPRPAKALLFGLALLLSNACGNEPSAASVHSRLIGGAPGGPSQVGRLTWKGAGVDTEVACTATLVAPDLVLSARHCLYRYDGQPLADSGKWFFTLSDSNDPSTWADANEVTDIWVPSIVETTNTVGWTPPFGTPDLSLLRLATPILGTLPLEISLGSVSLERPQFLAVGYGVATHEGTAAPGRSAGRTTLLALEGQPAHLRYSTLAAFRAAVSDALHFPEAQFNDVDLARIESWYDLSLAKGYEAQFGADAGDASPCHGDSGSPLLQPGVDGVQRIYGVDQSTIDLNPATRLCDFGPVYALFENEAARQFLSAHGLVHQESAGGGGSVGAAGASSGGAALGAAGSGAPSGGGAPPAGAGSIDYSEPDSAEPAGCSLAVGGGQHAGSSVAALFLGLAWVARRLRLRQVFNAARNPKRR